MIAIGLLVYLRGRRAALSEVRIKAAAWNTWRRSGFIAHCSAEGRREKFEHREWEATREGVALGLRTGYGRRDCAKPAICEIKGETGGATHGTCGSECSVPGKSLEAIVA